MKPELRAALADYLLALADDELILGHRDSEWCGHAPILEEDIAFANLALDEIGHAQVWYKLLAGLTDQDADTYPDELVYWRDVAAYRSAPLVELPKGDWAFTMLRQYLFDAAEQARLDALSRSAYLPLAEAASKISVEELYHLRHTQAWVRRLGLGTDESQRRMQAALDSLWPYGLALFDPRPGETALAEAEYVPRSSDVCEAWMVAVVPLLRESGLNVPGGTAPLPFNRERHTAYLSDLLADLQQVARLYPGARW